MIDAHHHFWHPARGDYGWMPKDDPVLSCPYGPAELRDYLATTGVMQTVLVQAAPSVAETEYLLGIADATEHVTKVVGWIDFEDHTQTATLERLAGHPKFAGVRPMIQDIAELDWMLRADIAWAFAALEELDLTFDCLGFPRHLPNFLKLLTRHPDLRCVVDHAMKPQIRDTSPEAFEEWALGLRTIALETSASCKLSGLVTEADTQWSDETLKPFVDHLLDCFGAERLMWGSDWPVVNLRCTYDAWHAQALRLTSDWGKHAQDQIFDKSARTFYRIA